MPTFKLYELEDALNIPTGSITVDRHCGTDTCDFYFPRSPTGMKLVITRKISEDISIDKMLISFSDNNWRALKDNFIKVD